MSDTDERSGLLDGHTGRRFVERRKSYSGSQRKRTGDSEASSIPMSACERSRSMCDGDTDVQSAEAAATIHRPTYDIHDVDMLLRDDDNESSPLLYGTGSLPTVLLDDDRYTATDIDESILPAASTLSEGGRLTTHESKKRRRTARKRHVSDLTLKPTKKTRFSLYLIFSSISC
ncbi:unnamed protein product [Toxocara canis]|uniref:Uncharacterized protein n=1 Tax=Toxocara canis TaxID=6265 RepID=A0A183VAN4_TOXCA|nr:unnamed protein product [Toxocara canis]